VKNRVEKVSTLTFTKKYLTIAKLNAIIRVQKQREVQNYADE